MKLRSVLKEKLVSKKTLDELHVDLGSLITSEEFDIDAPEDYRERAIERLKKLKRAFRSNINILYNLINKVIKIKCLYCGASMFPFSGGGNPDFESVTFKCENCGSKTTLTFPADGLRFVPIEEIERKRKL